MKGRANLVICADTVVVQTLPAPEEGRSWRVLEKPRDSPAAVAMLRSLSGTSHRVLTAVAFATMGLKGGSNGATMEHCFVESTIVHFADLCNEDIDLYVASGEPLYAYRAPPFSQCYFAASFSLSLSSLSPADSHP